MLRFVTSFVLICSFVATPAMAYVGPGSSLGAIGVALGIVGTLLLTLLSFVWYPIKRMHRAMRKSLARRRGASD